LDLSDFRIEVINEDRLVCSNQNIKISSHSMDDIGILFLTVSIHSCGVVDIINGVNKKSTY
jgi:hypothetical protein